MQALIKRIFNKEGHTIIEAIISLVVLLVLASVISLLIPPLQKQPTSTQFEESELFFSMLGKEVREGIAIEVKNNGLYIMQPSGDVLSITKYHSLIRKQVNGLGHEVWVQNIQEMEIDSLSETSLRVRLRDNKGKEYMRVFRRLN